jgi:hypothetical protein
MKLHRLSILVLLGSWLSSCGLLPAWDRSTGIVGQVQDAAGQPIEGAILSFYGRETRSNRAGCFTADVASTLPFTLHASASGYGEVQSHSESGHYRALITLQRVGAAKAGSIAWHSIPAREFRRSGGCT